MAVRLGLLAIVALVASGTAMAAPLVPRIVLQANNYVDIAAWTARDEFIVTVAGYERELTIWDVTRRVIVDRLVLPMPADIGSDLLVFDRIEIAVDASAAVVSARRFSVTELLPERVVSWRIDLQTRRVVVQPPRPSTGKAPTTKEAYLAPFMQRMAALTQLYEEDGKVITDAQALAALPSLPRSHDGKWTIERAVDGLVVRSGTTTRKLDTDPPLVIGHAALSPDGKILAMVATDTSREADDAQETRILLVDPQTGRSLPTLTRPGTYGRVQWLDQRRLALFANDDDDGRDKADPLAAVIPSPTLVVDMTTRRTVLSLAPRCYVAATDDGFIGAGLGNCRTVKADRKLWTSDANGRWSNPVDLGKGKAIDLIAVDASGTRVAVATSFDDSTLGIAVIDRVSGDTLDEIPLTGGVFSKMRFTDGGKSLLIAANSQLFRRRLGAKLANGEAEPIQQYGVNSVLPHLLIDDGTTILTASGLDAEIVRTDIVSGKRLAPLDHSGAIAGGFIDRGLIWAVSISGGLRMWDRTGRALFTSYFFPGERFFAQNTQGQYDTNLGADAKSLRWLMADAPWQSLAPQTFMRDLYEPGLVRKVVSCARGDCAAKPAAVPDLGALNRTLPYMRIVAVETAGGRATVTLAVQEGNNPAAANGKTRSGIYDVRLFRDGRLVRQTPDLGIARDEGKTLDQWRTATRVPRTADTVRLTYDIALPQAGGKVVLSAYAFNEDRVKGETWTWTVTVPPPPAPPRRRLVVVAIGVDATRHPDWQLSYAANDARALSAALQTAPGAEVTVIPLISDARGDAATKRNIRSVLLALSGQAGEDNLHELADARIDLAKLTPVGPDDAVVIAFSGHGTTQDKQFHLLPSDAAPNVATGEPLPQTMISAVELTAWLRQLDAGEIAFVIDACHSAASVDAAGFKPGPMGDPGLGQLAFDKGIRILAATQANDVALEDGALGHGLLSFALDEGLKGKADADGDGAVTLGEWLDYGVTRMPGLAAELREGKLRLAKTGASVSQSRGAVWFDDPDARITPVQQPALFDFTGTPGTLVLGKTAPARVATR